MAKTTQGYPFDKIDCCKRDEHLRNVNRKISTKGPRRRLWSLINIGHLIRAIHLFVSYEKIRQSQERIFDTLQFSKGDIVGIRFFT